MDPQFRLLHVSVIVLHLAFSSDPLGTRARWRVTSQRICVSLLRASPSHSAHVARWTTEMCPLHLV